MKNLKVYVCIVLSLLCACPFGFMLSGCKQSSKYQFSAEFKRDKAVYDLDDVILDIKYGFDNVSMGYRSASCREIVTVYLHDKQDGYGSNYGKNRPDFSEPPFFFVREIPQSEFYSNEYKVKRNFKGNASYSHTEIIKVPEAAFSAADGRLLTFCIKVDMWLSRNGVELYLGTNSYYELTISYILKNGQVVLSREAITTYKSDKRTYNYDKPE